MGQFFIVTSKTRLEYCIEQLRECQAKHSWMMVSLGFNKRSLSSNAISFVWYREIAAFQHDSEEAARNYCKLNFGLPILRADPKANKYFELSHLKWKVWCDTEKKPVSRLMQFDALPYEGRLAAMKYLSVTSLFDNRQMKNYLETVQKHFAEEGLVLDGKDAPQNDKTVAGS